MRLSPTSAILARSFLALSKTFLDLRSMCINCTWDSNKMSQARDFPVGKAMLQYTVWHMQKQMLACHKGAQCAQLHMTQMIVLAQQSSRQYVVVRLKADDTTIFCLHALPAQPITTQTCRVNLLNHMQWRTIHVTQKSANVMLKC